MLRICEPRSFARITYLMRQREEQFMAHNRDYIMIACLICRYAGRPVRAKEMFCTPTHTPAKCERLTTIEKALKSICCSLQTSWNMNKLAVATHNKSFTDGQAFPRQPKYACKAATKTTYPFCFSSDLFRMSALKTRHIAKILLPSNLSLTRNMSTSLHQNLWLAISK